MGSGDEGVKLPELEVKLCAAAAAAVEADGTDGGKVWRVQFDSSVVAAVK